MTWTITQFLKILFKVFSESKSNKRVKYKNWWVKRKSAFDWNNLLEPAHAPIFTHFLTFYPKSLEKSAVQQKQTKEKKPTLLAVLGDEWHQQKAWTDGSYLD